MKSKIQFRGHCQCCANQQAVIKGDRMSKHGYEVKDRGNFGWFQGVCSGHHYAPIEQDRTQLDEIVETIRIQCFKMRELAERYESGKAHPETCQTYKYDSVAHEYERVKWEDADQIYRDAEVKRQVHRLRRHAEMGEKQAKYMEEVAAMYHGKPLIEYKKPEAPTPIMRGEQKINKIGRVLTAVYTDRGMVSYTYTNDAGKQFQTKMSTRSWRLLPVVAE